MYSTSKDHPPLSSSLKEGVAAVRAPQARLPWWSLRHRGQLAWAVHLVLLAIFAVLAIFAHTLRADLFDTWVTGHIQQWHGLDWPLQVVSWFGYAPQQTIIDAVIIVTLFALRYRIEAAFLLVSVLGAALLDQLVKVLVARPRPSGPLVHVVTHLGSYSFPSGHVVSYLALFGFLAYIGWIELRSRSLRWTLIILCVGILILVGPSRIYLGAHWASDVLGAYFLGGLWLSVVLRSYVSWQERHPAAGG